MEIDSQIIESLGYCFFLLLLAIIFRKFPPKKINGLYGYRTATSMKSPEIWEAANRYWTSMFIKVCAFNFLFPVIGCFIFPKYIVLITVIATTITLLLTIHLTEMFLKKNFDKNGKRI